MASSFGILFTQADRELIQKLAAAAFSKTANKHEAQTAHDMLLAVLKKYKFKQIDLQAQLAEWDAEDKRAEEERRRRQSAAKAPKTKSGGKLDLPLKLTHRLLQQYIDMQEHEYVAVALWALHTHVYERFYHTPRLSLMSPTRQCGKSNTTKILKLLAHETEAVSSITTASLFRLLDNHGTVIIDEADNAELFTNPEKRGVINAGFDKTASSKRIHKETFDVFAPMAFGGIGRLPLPLMDRSLCIHLYRSSKNFPLLNPEDEVMRRPFDQAATLIADWAENVKLNPDPAMPFEVRARTADKWRVLVAIADSFGPEWSKRARDAAIAFGSSYSEQEVQTMLLLDCQIVFNRHHVERIRSEELVSGILDLDTHYPWTAYRGPKDDENVLPRKLKQGDMAQLLSMFQIRSKKIRFGTGPNSSFMGYERQQFQRHWDAYNPKKPGTPELKLIQGERQ
jgi:hypothetical protein